MPESSQALDGCNTGFIRWLICTGGLLPAIPTRAPRLFGLDRGPRSCEGHRPMTISLSQYCDRIDIVASVMRGKEEAGDRHLSINELGFEPSRYGIEKLSGRLPGFFRFRSFWRIRSAGIAEAPGILRESLCASQLSGGVSGVRQARLFQFLQIVRLLERNLVPGEKGFHRFFRALLGMEQRFSGQLGPQSGPRRRGDLREPDPATPASPQPTSHAASYSSLPSRTTVAGSDART
jgi:hypothetical protein